jgi:hypothetical protein
MVLSTVVTVLHLWRKIEELISVSYNGMKIKFERAEVTMKIPLFNIDKSTLNISTIPKLVLY